MDSNNTDAEVPEDLLEEQALQLKVKDFACRSNAKAKPQRREPVDYSPRIIPMNERNWIDIEPRNYSLCVRGFEESKPSSWTFSKQYNEKMRERFNSGELKNNFRVNFHKFLIGLTIVGKHAWQQEEEQKGDISTALMFHE